MKTILVTLFLFLVSNVNAQFNFIRDYSISNVTLTNAYSNLYKVIQTSDSGFACILPSKDSNNNNNSFTFLRTDKLGNIIWGNSYDIPGNWTTATDLIELTDSTFGVIGDSGLHSLIFWHISTNGFLIEAKLFKMDSLSYFENEARIVKTTDGNLLISSGCFTNLSGYGGNINALFKMDMAANPIWCKAFYRNNLQNSYNLVTGNSLGNYFGASTYDSVTIAPMAITDHFSLNIYGTDSIGNVLWYRKISDSLNSEYIYVADIICTTTGDLIVSGTDWGNLRNNFLIKLDGSGNVKWKKEYGYSYTDITSIAEMPDGSYRLLANRFSTNNKSIAINIDTAGNLISSNIVTYDQLIYSSVKTFDNGFIGITQTNSGCRLTKSDNGLLAGCNYYSTNPTPINDTYSDSTGFTEYNFNITGLDITSSVVVVPSIISVTDICLNTETNSSVSIKASLNIVPNPISDIGEITLIDDNTDNAEIVVYDQLGKEVLKKQFANNHLVINKDIFAAGIYFVKVFKANGVYFQKFIVE